MCSRLLNNLQIKCLRVLDEFYVLRYKVYNLIDYTVLYDEAYTFLF